MTIHNLDKRFIPDRGSPGSGAFAASGLWTRAGVVAAGIAAIALTMLVNGEAGAAGAIASALAGGAAAAFAWRRAWTLINRADAVEEAAAEAARAQPHTAGLGVGVESAASH